MQAVPISCNKSAAEKHKNNTLRSIFTILTFSKKLSFNDLLPNHHTHPFNGPFSRTTQVGRYQKGKTNLDFTEARDRE